MSDCLIVTHVYSIGSDHIVSSFLFTFFFFFNDTATTEIYTLSLHDALPISPAKNTWPASASSSPAITRKVVVLPARSEEHTSELQSQFHLVCRLLLEKKKNTVNHTYLFN